MNEIAAKLRAKGPIWFCERILGSSLFDYQKDIINAVFKYPRVTVRSGHSIGKTVLAANVMLSFLYLHKDSIVISTAPTARQVTKVTWKELRRAYNRGNNLYIEELGGKLLPKSPELYLSDDWFAIGLSTDDPDRFQGFHAEDLLVVVDEAAGVDEEIFEAIEGVLTSINCHLLLIGNPTNTSGTFYDSFQENGWKTFNISAFDTPNLTTFGITQSDFLETDWETKLISKIPYPFLVTPQWCYDKFLRWGPDSAIYHSRVLGNFPPEGSTILIPRTWINDAIERKI